MASILASAAEAAIEAAPEIISSIEDSGEVAGIEKSAAEAPSSKLGGVIKEVAWYGASAIGGATAQWLHEKNEKPKDSPTPPVPFPSNNNVGANQTNLSGPIQSSINQNSIPTAVSFGIKNAGVVPPSTFGLATGVNTIPVAKTSAPIQFPY